jgi:uncharacterized membrane protein
VNGDKEDGAQAKAGQGLDAPSPPPEVRALTSRASEDSKRGAGAPVKPGGEGPVVLPGAAQASQPLAQAGAGGVPPANPELVHVTVAPNLNDLVAGRVETPADARAARERRDLNEIVHRVLVFGLAVSTALMLVGLGLDLLRHREVPTAVPDFGEVFSRVAALRPSGFLALGLLVLVATPILRVVGSICAFLHERDWRYAAITFLVLLVVTISLLAGRG